MRTSEEIRADYKKQHADLTYLYYVTHGIGKANFELQHKKIWEEMTTELLNAGHISPPLPTEIDLIKKRLDTLEAV